MVADHAPVLVGVVTPHRQHRVHALVEVGQHAGDHVGIALGLDEIQQWVQRAVGIPQRKNRVVGEALRLVDVLVQPAVGAVDVLVDDRAEHRMVQGSVENRPLVLGQRLHLDPAQLTIPLVMGLGAHAVEVPVGQLGLQVAQRPGRADRRQRHFHQQWCFRFGIEIEMGSDLAAGHLGKIRFLVEAAIETVVRSLVEPAVSVGSERFAERQREVDGAGAGPTRGLPVTRDQGIVFHPQKCPHVLAVVVVDIGHQIQDDLGGAVLGEGIAVQGHPFRGGQFRIDTGVVKSHAIVPGFSLLGFVPEARGVVPTGMAVRLAHDGHQRDVAQIGMTRAAEVGVTEARDGIVIVLVAGAVRVGLAGVFSIIVVHLQMLRIGAGLDHAERNRGSRKSVAHVARADQGVDELRVVLSQGGPRAKPDCQKANCCSHQSA